MKALAPEIIESFNSALAKLTGHSRREYAAELWVAYFLPVPLLENKNKNKMKKQISTFLTFQENNAEEAMNFYVGLFENSKIIDVQRYGKDGPAKEGTIMVARFELNGSQFACSDSYIKHEWTFTPGVSNFVECKSDDEIENFFAKLSENGKVMMPLNNYGFSQKFGFVEDR